MARRRVVLGFVLFVAVTAMTLVTFRVAGTWLVVADPLQPARAVVVFGGQVPFRAMEAPAVYQQGWTREVWLTQGGLKMEDVALTRLGIERTQEYVYSSQVLEHLGVPQGRIRVLPGRNVNTAEEVRTIAREVKAAGADRVILITSKYHTRRVKALWHTLIGAHPEADRAIHPGRPLPARGQKGKGQRRGAITRV